MAADLPDTPAGPRAGRLLVAAPMLVDPNFFRTVVLVIEHGEDGALGVVLNRPSATPVAEALPAWKDVVTEPGIVFVGGPVQPTAALSLGRTNGAADGWDGIASFAGRLGTVDLDADPEAAAPHLGALRLFAGYAGWGAGQLEAEIEEGAWYVVDADEDDPFTVDPERLWSDVLRRQRGPLRMLSTYPLDVASN